MFEDLFFEQVSQLFTLPGAFDVKGFDGGMTMDSTECASACASVATCRGFTVSNNNAVRAPSTLSCSNSFDV